MTIREIVFESIEKYSELKSFSFPTKDGETDLHEPTSPSPERIPTRGS